MHSRRPHPSTPGARSGSSGRAPGRLGLVSLASLVAAVAAVALPTAAGAQTGGSVNLVAYSTPKPAYTVLAQDFERDLNQSLSALFQT